MFQPIADIIDSSFPEFTGRDLSKLPNCTVLNKEFDLLNVNQKFLKFTPQDSDMPYPELSYEERIYQQGLIASRSHNWHDFFNALVWKKFPKTKAALNAIHYQELSKQKNSMRSRKRDLLTLFDECGVIVIANDDILNLIRSHNWHELFVSNRKLWLQGEIQTITFGHAMYEKYLNPYIGMTAQALLLDANIVDLDKYLARRLLKQTLLMTKAELSPLPLLGIPDWYNTQDAEFYANTNYFRPQKP